MTENVYSGIFRKIHFQIISKEGLSENVKSLVKQTLEKLYQLQISTQNKIDFTKTLNMKAMMNFR
jgi:F0F1-type ATP synthase delta subunit